MRESLEMTARRGGSWCEMAASLGVSQSAAASNGVNSEAEEATVFETVTRRQPVKIQQTEKTWCVLL
jgi:hypothetical protein